MIRKKHLLCASLSDFDEEVFLKYCQGERGILRSRINRFKDGCEAYYVYCSDQQGIKEEDQGAEIV